MEKKPDYCMYSLIASIVGLVIGLRIVGGILGIYFANEAEKNNQDLSMANAGKIIGIIDIVLGALIILTFIGFFAIFGFTAIKSIY